jgi:hypothetical protein
MSFVSVADSAYTGLANSLFGASAPNPAPLPKLSARPSAPSARPIAPARKHGPLHPSGQLTLGSRQPPQRLKRETCTNER